MHADYLEIKKNFLSHASMAGMPTNVARRLGYKKVTGDVNTGVGAEEKAKARVNAAKKKVDELYAKIEDYSNSLYNAMTKAYSLNPIKRAEAIIALVKSIANRKDYDNIVNEYRNAQNEYTDAVQHYNTIQHLLAAHRMDKEFEEFSNRANNDFNRSKAKSKADFDKSAQEMDIEFNKRVADNKAAMDREYTKRVNAMLNTSKGSKAGMPSNIKNKRKR